MDPVKQLKLLIEKNSMGEIKKLIKKHIFTDDDLINPFVYACENGHSDVAKFLADQFKDDEPPYDEGLMAAAVNGHLDIAVWCAANPSYDIHDCYEYIFSTICGRGNIKLAKQIVKKLPDIIYNKYTISEALIASLQNEKYKMIEWLIDNYGNKINIYDCYKYVFLTICGSGKIKMTKHIIKKFPDIVNENNLINEAIIKCIQNDKYKMIGWLTTYYGNKINSKYISKWLKINYDDEIDYLNMKKLLKIITEKNT